MTNSLYSEMAKSLRTRWRAPWSANPAFNPLRRAFDESLATVGALSAKCQRLRSTNRFSTQGLQEEVRNAAQMDTVPALRKAVKALETARAVVDTKRRTLAIPKADPADLTSQRIRGEMRAHLRSLGAAQALQVLMHDKVDERLVLAAMEVPPAMVGLTDQMADAVQKNIIAKKFGDELGILEEFDEAIALTTSAVQIAIQQMRRDIGFTDRDNAKFDDWMAAASARADTEEGELESAPHVNEGSLVGECRKEIDAIWAERLPELYGPGANKLPLKNSA